MGRWMGGWIGGWVAGWMDGEVDRSVDKKMRLSGGWAQADASRSIIRFLLSSPVGELVIIKQEFRANRKHQVKRT